MTWLLLFIKRWSFFDFLFLKATKSYFYHCKKYIYICLKVTPGNPPVNRMRLKPDTAMLFLLLFPRLSWKWAILTDQQCGWKRIAQLIPMKQQRSQPRLFNFRNQSFPVISTNSKARGLPFLLQHHFKPALCDPVYYLPPEIIQKPIKQMQLKI